MRAARRVLAAAVILPLALSACTGSDEPAAESTPHGYVEGASEQPEPQLALVGVTDTGAVTMLDLLSGETSEIAEIGEVSHAATDGRFVAAATPEGVALVDSGRWTVDHGDHSHYYRAQAQLSGTIEDLEGPVSIASTETRTVVLAQGSGRAVVLDRSDLGQGEVTEIGAFETTATSVEPLGESLVVADDDGVRLTDASGESTSDPTPCSDPTGSITTRVGVTVSCAEGAVLVTAEDAAPESIPYPHGADPSIRATTLDARTSRPTVAGVAGDRGVWLLDTRERSWTLVETEAPVQRAVAVDDTDEHVVTVDEAGRVVVLTADGQQVGATDAVLADEDEPLVELDASRAYVPVTDGTVLEIDYADAARVARTLELDAPFLAEVG